LVELFQKTNHLHKSNKDASLIIDECLGSLCEL
jgi:hypothetical protein